MSNSSDSSDSANTSDSTNSANTSDTSGAENTGGIIDDIFGEEENINGSEEVGSGNQEEVEDDSSESSVEIESTPSFDETMESGETIDIVGDGDGESTN